LTINSDKVVNIYLCGPTVYNHVHIGNLRPVIIFDVLHRLLLTLDIKVNYIQNITDIDDKIIVKAHQEKTSEKKISNHYMKAYLANLVRYNILFPKCFPLVSEYIPEIKKFVEQLIEKKHAYQAGSEVFFRVEGNTKYGELSGQKLKKLRSNFRTVALIDKEDKKDFVLWKKTDKGIKWNSPWGLGRPGWHTECAVFIQEFFNGAVIDIHGGGSDLLFPHHENERIQYLAQNNREISKIWLHVAHIHWKKEKMSKSLGNTILAKYFCEKYGTNVLRYLILNSHYYQVINLQESLIQQGVDYIQRITNLLKKVNFYLYLNKSNPSEEKIALSEEFRQETVNHLLNNLNTIKVLYQLEKIINFLNKNLSEEKTLPETEKAINNFHFILNILGFKFELPIYDFSDKLLIKKWQTLRSNRQYEQADKIRKQLQKKNIL